MRCRESGRRGGLKRTENTTPEQRKSIAMKAISIRWGKPWVDQFDPVKATKAIDALIDNLQRAIQQKCSPSPEILTKMDSLADLLIQWDNRETP